jgi:pimeloyl-ACP methyl ester carboxylesterase
MGYLDLITELGDEYRIIALDTPGFGASDPLAGTVTVPALGQALLDAISQLEINDFWLYGHHTGAAIAAWMAAAEPSRVDRLMLSGPPLLDEELRTRLKVHATEPAISEDGQHLIAAWERHRRLAHDVSLDVAQREIILSFTADQPHLTYQAVLEFDFVAALESISCPTYVMGGENDTIHSGLLPTHEVLESSQMEVVPLAGIYLADQVPELVAARIRTWLS